MSDPEYLIANGFDKAIIGIGSRINLDNMTWEEAVEFMDYNVCGAWVGEKTPIFIRCDPTLDGTVNLKEKCQKDQHVTVYPYISRRTEEDQTKRKSTETRRISD